MATVWEFLEEDTEGVLEGIRDLANWSTNYTDGLTPLGVFLDLVGYSAEHFGESLVSDPSEVLGWHEFGLLADALRDYANNPREAEAWIDRLMELEAQD